MPKRHTRTRTLKAASLLLSRFHLIHIVRGEKKPCRETRRSELSLITFFGHQAQSCRRFARHLSSCGSRATQVIVIVVVLAGVDEWEVY